MQDDRNNTAFNSFGSDLKAAQQALKLSRKKFSELINIDLRYLSNIESSGFT